MKVSDVRFDVELLEVRRDVGVPGYRGILTVMLLVMRLQC